MEKEKSKTKINSGKLGAYLIIMNLIALAVFFIITKIFYINDTLTKSIILAVIGFGLTYFGCKYLLCKKYEVPDSVNEIKKNLIISFLVTLIVFSLVGIGSTFLYKNNQYIQILPLYNFSAETQVRIQKQAKYPVVFPPIHMFHASEATERDVEILEEQIKEEDEKIDNRIKENKISWIITVAGYSISYLIGLAVIFFNLNKWKSSDIQEQIVNEF